MTRIAAEGMVARIARHAAMARATHRWVEGAARAGLGTGMLAPDGHRSPTVTVVTLPESVPAADVLQAMEARGYTVAAGYGQLKRGSVRIGHMGEHTVEGVERCLAALGETLRDMR